MLMISGFPKPWKPVFTHFIISKCFNKYEKIIRISWETCFVNMDTKNSKMLEGLCAMFFVFLVFMIFHRKWSPKGSKMIRPFIAGGPPERTQNAPKSHLRHNLDFSSILHGFWSPFSLIFDDFGCHFGLFSLLVRRFRRFPNTYPLKLIRRFPPRGAAVSALRSQRLLASLLTSIFRLFSKMAKVIISEEYNAKRGSEPSKSINFYIDFSSNFHVFPNPHTRQSQYVRWGPLKDH